MESIRYLRQHPRTGLLHYRRVIPPHLRPHVGIGTISRSLCSTTQNLDALSLWIEANHEAERRLGEARIMFDEAVEQTVRNTVHKTVEQTVAETAFPSVTKTVSPSVTSILIDARASMAARR